MDYKARQAEQARALRAAKNPRSMFVINREKAKRRAVEVGAALADKNGGKVPDENWLEMAILTKAERTEVRNELAQAQAALREMKESA